MTCWNPFKGEQGGEQAPARGVPPLVTAVGSPHCRPDCPVTGRGAGIKSLNCTRLCRSVRGGACRLLADGVDIRIIQLMLGHSDVKTTQRYLNITDEEMRKALTGVWERRRQLKAVGE